MQDFVVQDGAQLHAMALQHRFRFELGTDPQAIGRSTLCLYRPKRASSQRSRAGYVFPISLLKLLIDACSVWTESCRYPPSLFALCHKGRILFTAVVLVRYATLHGWTGSNPINPCQHAWELGAHFLLRESQGVPGPDVRPSSYIRNAILALPCPSKILPSPSDSAMLSTEVIFDERIGWQHSLSESFDDNW